MEDLQTKVFTTDFAVRVEAALVKYLRTKPRQTELMNRVGLYLRARNLNPPESIKRFILSRPQKFAYSEDSDGHNIVTLIKDDAPRVPSLTTKVMAPSQNVQVTRKQIPVGIPKDLGTPDLTTCVLSYGLSL